MGKVLRSRSSLYTGQPVVWTGLTNVTITGETLVNTGSGNWAAGGASTQTLAGGTDGWVEYTIVKTSPRVAVGLSDVNSSNNVTTTDFAWDINGTALRPFENGTAKGTAILPVPGDVLRVERVNGKIYYKRNGLIHYTSAVTSTSQLIADVAFHQNGASISKVRLSETFATFSATPQYTIRRFVYDHSARLLETWHSLNGTDEILLAKNEYNELSQLVDKKLHSTVSSGADSKQSVDYRYNIRGWLTSINNAELAEDDVNDDTGDLFGMNLAYNDDLSTGNAASLQYNGNISAVKWSNNAGFAFDKAQAYNFSYDAMNRLLAANHLKRTALNVWTTGEYDENGLSYDLNGNILSLSRKGKGALVIDNLNYNYGSGTSKSNRLLYVTDNTSNTTDKLKGFTDGNTSGNDYAYDLNGNMLTDLNKNITSNITYNHLNLPQTVTRNNSSVTYLYDASGKKHSQVFTSDKVQRTTDYLNSVVLENNEAQFVQHEEGRIALQERNKVFSTDGSVLTLFTATTSFTLSSETINGETYVKATPVVGATLAKKGTTPIGGTFSVVAGQRYIYRVKGYSNSTKVAYLYVKGNTADLIWTGANLPTTATSEMWVETDFTIPAGITQISLGVMYNAGTATASDYFRINEVELQQVNALTPEYQYHLKDHLGNVRLTFTTKPAVTTNYSADFESSTNNNFLNYTRNNFDLVDHTDENGTVYTYTQLLNGGSSGRVGLAKTIPVMPGDEVTISAYGKYMNLGDVSNATSFINALAGAFGVSAGATGEALKVYNGLNSWAAFVPGGDHPEDDETPPKAFVTILFFDKDYNLVDAAWDQMTTDGEQTSGSVKEPHDLLSVTAKAPAAGYAYVFLSNEHYNYVDVYFDDVTLAYTPSAIVQQDDYYPFGLKFNSYSRENSTPQDYLYNSKELQDELNLGWYDYQARQYDPAIARWMSIDPRSEISRRWSPYVYAYNNPIRFIDPDGMSAEDPNKKTERLRTVDLSLDADGVQQVTQNTKTVVTTKNVDENGKVTYTKTTTETSVTNTIRAEVKDGKTVWNVEKGDVSIKTSTQTLDKKGAVISDSGPNSSSMSQADYKKTYGTDGGNPLHHLEVTSDKVAALSTQYQQKYHSVIMDKIQSANSAGQFVVDQVNKFPIDLYKSATSAALGKGPINFHSYHSIQNGNDKPQLKYLSDQNTGQHYDYYNPFRY
jgi:RHS repeat-associated protein